MTDVGTAYIDIKANPASVDTEVDAAGKAAGTKFAEAFTKDAQGRLHDASGRFISKAEVDKAADSAGESAGRSFADRFRAAAGNLSEKLKAGAKNAGGGLLSGIGFGAELAVGEDLVDALKEHVSEFVAVLKENATAAAQTNVQLKATGAISGESAKGIASLSDEIANYSGQTAASVQDAANVLLRFQGIRNQPGTGNDIFTQTLKSSADLATALKEGPTQAAQQLARALEQPSVGLRQLRRAGIELSASQTALITKLVDSGNTLKAQKIILDDVNRTIGGSAKAYGETLPGAIDRVKHSLSESGANLVAAFTPEVTKLVNGFADRLVALAPRIDAFVDRLAEGFSHLVTEVRPFFDFFAKNAGTIIRAIAGIAGAFLAFKVINGVIDKVKELGEAISVLVENPEILIVVALGVALYELYQHSATVRAEVELFVNYLRANLLPIIRDGVNKVLADLKVALAQVEAAFERNKPQIEAFLTIVREVAQFIIVALVEGAFAYLEGAIQKAADVISNLIDFFGYLYKAISAAVKFTSDIFHGQWTDAFHDAEQVVGNLGAFVLTGFKTIVDIVLDSIATMIGAIGGFVDKIPLIGHALGGSLDDAKGAVADAKTSIDNTLSGFAADAGSFGAAAAANLANSFTATLSASDIQAATNAFGQGVGGRQKDAAKNYVPFPNRTTAAVVVNSNPVDTSLGNDPTSSTSSGGSGSSPSLSDVQDVGQSFAQKVAGFVTALKTALQTDAPHVVNELNTIKSAVISALKKPDEASTRDAVLDFLNARVKGLETLATRFATATKQLASINDQLKTAASDQASIQSSLLDSVKLANAFNGQSLAPGVVAPASLFTNYLATQVTQAQNFAAQITALRKAGLNQVLLQQIAGDSTNGGAEATSILAGGAGAIASLNASQDALKAATGVTAQQALANQVSTLTAEQKTTNALLTQIKNIEAQQAAAVGKELNSAVGGRLQAEAKSANQKALTKSALEKKTTRR